jgi:hypothetical protein
MLLEDPTPARKQTSVHGQQQNAGVAFVLMLFPLL